MAYFFIFVAVLFEGPMATLAAAALAVHDPQLKVIYVFVVASLGNLTADVCWYFLGSLGKYGKVLAYIPWIRYQQGLVDRATQEIQQRGLCVFIVTKLGFGIGTIPLLIAAGMLHINRKQWIFAAVVTEVIWTGTLLFVGTFAGNTFHRFVIALFKNGIVVAMGGMAFVALFLLYKTFIFISPRSPS